MVIDLAVHRCEYCSYPTSTNDVTERCANVISWTSRRPAHLPLDAALPALQKCAVVRLPAARPTARRRAGRDGLRQMQRWPVQHRLPVWGANVHWEERSDSRTLAPGMGHPEVPAPSRARVREMHFCIHRSTRGWPLPDAWRNPKRRLPAQHLPGYGAYLRDLNNPNSEFPESSPRPRPPGCARPGHRAERLLLHRGPAI